MKITELTTNFKRYVLLERRLRIKTYKSILSSLISLQNFAQTSEIDSMNQGIIREYLYHGVEERGWEPKTVHNHWQNLKSFFDWCIKRKIIKKNPVLGIEKPRLKKQLPRCISNEEVSRFIMHLYGIDWTYQLEKSRNEAIVFTLLSTGLRLQELLNLETNDVDIEGMTIFVRMGKGNKDRIIPIYPKLQPKLRRYFEERKKTLKPSKWFFTGIKSDKQLCQRDVRRILNAISIASGVKVTAHMLRHTFGKIMTEGDCNAFKLKDLMGHSQITTTQRYVSVETESIKKVFDKVRIF